MNSVPAKLTCIILSIFLITVSCDSTNSNNDTPPELPPEESMRADFSEMDNAESAKAKAAAEAHFNTALITAGVLKVILDVNLFVPRVLVNAAQEHDPEEISDGEWEWEYFTQANENNYGVRLTAETNGNSDVHWRFFVTNTAANPPLDNELFFEGTSDYEATSGTWTYYDPSSGEQASLVTWSVGENEKSITLEVTSDRNDNLGDAIEYNFDGTVKTAVYTDASSGETTTINFNTETHTGFIISPDYNNGEKACWDEELNNIACEEV